MKDIRNGLSQDEGASKVVALKRKIGEGSFVGLKEPTTLRELVIWLRHLYAYKYAERFAEGKLVLDIGCGIGYGVNELSTKACYTIGIDIWKEGIRYANQKYGSTKSSFLVASGSNLPFRDDSFDLVVSFQVIEHIHQNAVLNFLKEIKRCLRSNGTLIISTPNKRLRLLPFQKPWNPDHKVEYDEKGLRRITKKVFGHVKIMGLYAKKDAYLIEYNRVRQNPIQVLLMNPITRLFRRAISTKIITRLKIIERLYKKKVERRDREKKEDIVFSIGDFRLFSLTDSCLDLYAVCRK